MDRLWATVVALVKIGEARGVSGETEAHFRDNTAAVDLVLTNDERKVLDDVSALQMP